VEGVVEEEEDDEAEEKEPCAERGRCGWRVEL
jgi:hypothetical protein